MANTFKKARNFLKFDVEEFQRLHDFQLLKIERAYEYKGGERDESKSHIKALLMIIDDYTDEKLNSFVQLTVHFPKVAYNEHNIKQFEQFFNKRVELVNPQIAVYGEWQNQLSIKSESIKLKND